MAKQVMDIKPGIGMTLSQSNEHLRVAVNGAFTSRFSYNVDPTRDKLNFEIKNGEVVPVDKHISIPRRIETILWQRGIKDPNKEMLKKGKEPNRRTIANFILGGSRDQMHRLAFGNQEVNLEHGANNSAIKRMPEIENWAKDMYRFMSDRFGEKNIAAFVVHLDETNPHIHCTVLPITKDEKLSWRKVMVGENNSKFEYQKRTTELHNAIAEINAKYGLERGEPIAETGAKHRSTAEYHEALRKELKEQNKRLFDTKIVLDEAIEKNKETIKEQNGLCVSSLHILTRRSRFRLRPFRPALRPLADLAGLGSAAFLNECSSGLVLVVFNLLTLRLAGTLGVAAYGIVANLALMALALFTGVNQGVQPLVSLAHGRGDAAGVRTLCRMALGLALCAGLCMAALAFFAAGPLVSLFNRDGDPALQQMAEQGLRLYFLGFPFAGLNLVTASFLGAAEHPSRSLRLSLLRGFVAIVAAALLLAALLGLTGVWLAFPAAEGAVLLVSLRLSRSLRRARPEPAPQAITTALR